MGEKCRKWGRVRESACEVPEVRRRGVGMVIKAGWDDGGVVALRSREVMCT